MCIRDRYNPEEWTLLPGEEVTEILMHEPEKFYIRRIVRHTAKRKGTNAVSYTHLVPSLTWRENSLSMHPKALHSRSPIPMASQSA